MRTPENWKASFESGSNCRTENLRVGSRKLVRVHSLYSKEGGLAAHYMISVQEMCQN